MNVTIRPTDQKSQIEKPAVTESNAISPVVISDGIGDKTKRFREKTKLDQRPPKIRCNSCNKKLSMNFFDCKCGKMYCSEHRYPDVHSCPIDYKKLGRELLEKNNPVVSADKLKDRI
ncbi:MAG: putative zinc finger A20 and AN1 domain-containing stress-associated protein 8 [Harvfovirus sp.]|uniref:Putative zinc finger A20 and AN1 domain-containing stress-associated protein 8 n=1 Tax=Harvfovirus sp. TaxID=2487768 RepID=A0A3G5A1V7_9VIRU|nr:MAG: putative zinc finger A20 and AN1 domain-containing stress-associated protein 8 [Harvfovirus sp.]